jgi:mannose-1-phosphate guanylyltransferase
MKLVLLSGGSGTRLWPLSNRTRSKQFLKVLKGPDGKTESMVERVWRQLGEAGLQDSAWLVAGGEQVDLLRSQLGKHVPIIVEPERRDTFPAVALAVSYLHSVENAGPDETVVVLPVDPYVETDFFRRIADMEDVLDRTGADLALIGTRPDHPSEKFGYIVPAEGEAWLGAGVAGSVTGGAGLLGDGEHDAAGGGARLTGNAGSIGIPGNGNSGCPGSSGNRAASGLPGDARATGTARHAPFRVAHFREKPGRAEAERLIRRGALWNCGVFVFRLGYVLNLLRDNGLPLKYEALDKRYSRLAKMSFDHAVVEKAQNIVAVVHDGPWKDLGTWSSLTEELSDERIGKGVLAENSEGTHLINELDIPVAVLGIRNAVVAAGPDGVIVAAKPLSHKIKEIGDWFEHRPMLEEYHWGESRVVERLQDGDGGETIVRRVRVKDGEHIGYHVHLHRREMWVIVAGDGEAVIGGRLKKVAAGDVLPIPQSVPHGIRGHRGLVFLEIQKGAEVAAGDVLSVCDDWQEIRRIGS